MTTTCSFCSEPGHNIRTCSDIRIENGWRDILCRSNFIRFPNLNDDVLEDVQTYLQTFPTLLLTGVAVQFAQSHVSDSVETKINNIRLWIYREAARYESLPEEEKGGYLYWLDPGTYLPDGTLLPDLEDDFDDLPDLVTDDEDDFIPFNDVTPISNYLIEPRLLCTESADELAAQCECPICFEEDRTLFDMNTTSCQHSFCHSCIMTHLRIKNSCPMCRTTVTTLQVRKTENYDEVNEVFGPITLNTQSHVFHMPNGRFGSTLRRLQPIYLPPSQDRYIG